MEKSTNKLNEVLKTTHPDKIEDYLKEQAKELISGDQPFAKYMREIFRKKKMAQRIIFLKADMADGYGYKIISGEKRTKQRDTILRICFAAQFTLEETQRALKIYGMSPLYARIPRDAILIVAFNSLVYEISDVNNLLEKHGEMALKGTEQW